MRRVIDGRVELLAPFRLAQRQPRHLAVDAVGDRRTPEEQRAADDRRMRGLRDEPRAARADEEGQDGGGVRADPELQQHVAEDAADPAVNVPR